MKAPTVDNVRMVSRCRRPNRPLRHRSGAAAVEFAIVAPIFFLLLMASVEFSRLNVLRHTADNAAYEAARHAMVPGATANEAVDRAHAVMGVVGARGTQVTIEPPLLGPNVENLSVTVEVPLDQNGWIVPRFTRSLNLRARSTMKTERPGR